MVGAHDKWNMKHTGMQVSHLPSPCQNLGCHTKVGHCTMQQTTTVWNLGKILPLISRLFTSGHLELKYLEQFLASLSVRNSGNLQLKSTYLVVLSHCLMTSSFCVAIVVKVLLPCHHHYHPSCNYHSSSSYSQYWSCHHHCRGKWSQIVH